MKKVKIILTLLSLSLILVLNGCDSEVKTAPWSERDIERMENEKQEKVPIVRIDF